MPEDDDGDDDEDEALSSDSGASCSCRSFCVRLTRRTDGDQPETNNLVLSQFEKARPALDVLYAA